MTYPTWRAGARARFARLLAWAAVCAWVLAAPGGAAAASATGDAVSETALAPTGVPQLTLPAPTGRLPIGVQSTFLADPSRIEPATGRPRTLPIRVWYPAHDTAAGAPARYLSPAVQQVVEQALGAPTGTFDVGTHAASPAPMRRHIRGVILVSPGLGNLVAFSTAQVIDLASRGWVLVTFDHPHDTYVVEQPDGTLIFSDPDGVARIEALLAQRVLDVGVVLRHLSELVPQAQPEVPVGMFGHSLGGATAAEALLEHPRLQAGVDIDGTPWGRVVQEGLDEPFGIMIGRREPGMEDPNLDLLISNLRGPHPFEQLDIAHNGFTDFVMFNAQATLSDPALAARFESFFATGVDDVAAGAAALAAQRRFLLDFMRRYVTACHDIATTGGHAALHDGADAGDRHRLPVCG